MYTSKSANMVYWMFQPKAGFGFVTVYTMIKNWKINCIKQSYIFQISKKIISIVCEFGIDSSVKSIG